MNNNKTIDLSSPNAELDQRRIESNYSRLKNKL